MNNIETEQPAEVTSNFIIKLNWVDYITLSSVATTWISMMLTLNGLIYAALALLFLAMLADAFDGILARKYGTERSFGRYLDGFMDVLIYLVSPGLILYQGGFDGVFSLFIVVMIAFGCIRLSVFNDIGNIQESDGLSYLGMPVFWSIPIVGVYQILAFAFDNLIVDILLAIALCAFSYFMIVRRPFFKFTSLAQILSITIGGFLVFLALEFHRSISLSLSDLAIVSAYLMWPIIFAGIGHMVIVTKDMFRPLKIPVNTRLFGENKTLRGFVVMPLLTILGFITLLPFEAILEASGKDPILSDVNIYVLGAVSGFLYVLAELPNSFLKRRMGAKPGETPDRFRLGFVLLDQIDSALFIALGYVLFFGFHWTVCLVVFAMSPVVALLVKRVLYLAKLKKTKT